MSSPQTENGYCRIANELMDAIIAFPFSKRQYAMLFAVVRKTYGFNKKQDDMTVTQLAEMTGLDRANASKTLDELASIGAVSKQHGKYGYVLGLNKNYKSWNPVLKQHTRVKTTRRACQNNTDPVLKQHTQKTIPKRQSPKDNAGENLPPCIPEKSWSEWIEYRRQIKKPMSELARVKSINKLVKLAEDGFEPSEIIDNAIEKGWQGLYAPAELKHSDQSEDLWAGVI